MALELPSLLANTLEGLGFHWTNTDENGLSAMGDTWVDFTGTPRTHASTVNDHIDGALSSNQGEGIDAMNAVWSQKDAAHQNLAIGGSGAARVGAGLQICAIVVLALKANVIVQVANLDGRRGHRASASIRRPSARSAGFSVERARLPATEHAGRPGRRAGEPAGHPLADAPRPDRDRAGRRPGPSGDGQVRHEGSVRARRRLFQ
jgi:hypothetical protein